MNNGMVLINTDVVIGSIILALIGCTVLMPDLLRYQRTLKLASSDLGFWQRLLAPFGLATAKQKALADLLPWRRLVNHQVVKNHNGAYVAAWRIAGADMGTLNDEEVINTAYHVAATIGSSLPSTKIQLYARRAPFREYVPGLGSDHPVSKMLDTLRAEFFLQREPVYHTERTLVLTWLPPSEKIEHLRAAVAIGVEAQLRNEQEILSEFVQICDQFESALSTRTLSLTRLGARTLRDRSGTERRSSELVSFLNMCLTGFHVPLVPPPPGISLSDHLAVEVRGGYEPRIGELEVSAIVATSYPPEAIPGMLDRLTHLKISHLLHISFTPQSVADASKQLSAAASDFKAAANFTAERYVDPALQASHEEMVDAIGQTHGDYTHYGYASFTILVRARSRSQIRKAERAVEAALNECMVRATVRRLGSLDTILSTLPGQVGFGKRREYLMDALTIAKLFPLHEASLGRKYSESESFAGLDVPPLTYALGPGGQFFRQHLNVKDIFSGIKFGRTGVGKSVGEAFESAMFLTRLPQAGITILDRGPSAYQVCKMFDGKYYRLLGAHSPGFALFSEAHIPAQAREVYKIIKRMSELSGIRVDGKLEYIIKDGIRVLGTRPRRERSFLAFWEQLQDPEGLLRLALKKYTRLGDVGCTFDAVEDSFETGRFNVIDLEQVMGLEPELLIPMLEVITWKTRTSVRRMKDSMGPEGAKLHWRFAIDEFNNSLMRHPIGAQFASDLLLMGRKENFSLSLATNSVKSFADAPGCSDIMLATASRVYYNDPAAKGENMKYYKQFDLPQRGIEMLSELHDHEFVLHQPEANILRRLSHRLDKNILAVIGTSRSATRVDEYIARFPAERYGIHHWKQELLKAQGAHEAADLLMRFITSGQEHPSDSALVAA